MVQYRCIGCNEIHDDSDFNESDGDVKLENIPRCSICDKPMKFAVDSHTKKLSKYLFEFDCNCNSEELRLAIG